MKKLVMVIAVAVVAVMVLLFAKNIIAQTAVSAAVKAITGLKVSMKSIDVGILNTYVDVKGLKLYNPPDFPGKVMLDMPDAYVKYDLGALLKGEVHLEDLRIDIKRLTVVKDDKGRVNLDALTAIQKQKGEAGAPEGKKAKTDMLKMQIDSMSLKIDQVALEDYSRGARPAITEFNININEQYKNITDPYSIASLIVFKALINTTISSIVNFDLGPLKYGLRNTLGSATQLATKAVGGVAHVGGGAAKTATKTAAGAAKTAAGAAVTVAEDITKILPFGKKE